MYSIYFKGCKIKEHGRIASADQNTNFGNINGIYKPNTLPPQPKYIFPSYCSNMEVILTLDKPRAGVKQ